MENLKKAKSVNKTGFYEKCVSFSQCICYEFKFQWNQYSNWPTITVHTLFFSFFFFFPREQDNRYWSKIHISSISALRSTIFEIQYKIVLFVYKNLSNYFEALRNIGNKSCFYARWFANGRDTCLLTLQQHWTLLTVFKIIY
jgi:hypothetical protein